MLKFFHGYHPDVWDALVKSGMMTEYDGVRIPQDITIREYKQFNNVAKLGGHLHKFMLEHKCPFYIDRFQGGIPFPYAYDFDKELLEEYKNLLGENFWGFQMHEWASNYRGEMERVEEALKEFKVKYSGTGDKVVYMSPSANTFQSVDTTITLMLN